MTSLIFLLIVQNNLQNYSGVYIVERLLILFPPPCLWFSSPRRVASRYKIFVFLPLKAIKQYILGLNSVKLSCSNCILPFGTTKSVRSPKIFFFHFFKLLIFFPTSKPFNFIPPLPTGGGNTQFYTPLDWYLLSSVVICRRLPLSVVICVICTHLLYTRTVSWWHHQQLTIFWLTFKKVEIEIEWKITFLIHFEQAILLDLYHHSDVCHDYSILFLICTIAH